MGEPSLKKQKVGTVVYSQRGAGRTTAPWEVKKHGKEDRHAVV